MSLLVKVDKLIFIWVVILSTEWTKHQNNNNKKILILLAERKEYLEYTCLADVESTFLVALFLT